MSFLAENRLIGMHTGDLASPQANDKWLQFKYDYMGRRVEKTYSVRSGSSWVVQSGYPQRFVYDRWSAEKGGGKGVRSHCQ